MRVWRICRAPHAALDGEGGLHVSGRWHTRGHRVVYAAQSAALAALEVLVHVETGTAPAGLRLLTIEVPDDVHAETVPAAALPTGWRSLPSPAALQVLGTGWLQSLRSVALVVPSAVIPEESCVLLNPAHADFTRVRVVRNVVFTFDTRLL